jgi:putative NADH-flavin reductase
LKLALFGATGRTGRQLLEQALKAGHEVTVFTRSPDKLDVKHPSSKLVG